MSGAIDKHVPKPRKRPSIRGHKGIERGSADAVRLFWADADAIGEAAGPAGSAKLPDPSRYGFASAPTPADQASHKAMRAWHRRERECARHSVMRLTLEQRAQFYWGSVDHHAMGGMTGPDPYVFGYDEHPSTRPPEYPEPPFVRENRELLAGATAPIVADPLGLFGLTSPATAQDVQRAWARMVRDQKLHPDQGGDPSAFVKLAQARDVALTFTTSPEAP